MKNYAVLLMLLLFGKASSQNIFTSLDSGLVACYAFSGNANDLSGNNQHGVVNGATLVADRFGTPNSAYSFAGYINPMNIVVPGFSSQLNGTGVSISFWTSKTTNAYDAAFLMSPDNTTNRLAVSVYYSTSNNVYWDYGNMSGSGNGRQTSSSPLPASNVWDHWVFVSGSNAMKIYKNGVLHASKASASVFSPSPTRDLLIGAGLGTSNGQLWYNGKLDDIRIYKRVLLANEVAYIYSNNAGCDPCPSTPTPSNSTAASTLCVGNSATLSATGTPTLQWYATPSATQSFASGTTYINPITASAGNYTYYVRSRNGCNSSSPVPISFSVNPSPTIIASASTSSICAGNPMQIVASGATNYTWTPTNSQSTTLSISPLSTTVYTLQGETNGCTSSVSILIPVTSIPSVSVAASNSVICLGKTTLLSGSGAANYTWQPGNIQSPAISVSPLSTTAYTLIGESAGCTNTAAITMSVVNPPTVSISGSSLICLGNSALLLAAGAHTYTWFPGNVQSQVLSVSPTSNTTYSVTGEAAGCNHTAIITMSVINPPTVLISASEFSVCPGSPISFTATGANTYTWNNGATAAVISVSPTSATSYTVTGYSVNNCSATAAISVFVHTVSPITIAASSGSICTGETIHLIATGATSYTWNNGAQSNTISASPVITTTYAVSGTDTLNSCTNSATYIQDVNDCTGLSKMNTVAETLHIYPNPTTGRFTITGLAAAEVIICNSLGEVVYKNRYLESEEINLENMASGIYIITLQVDNQIFTRKLIKN